MYRESNVAHSEALKVASKQSPATPSFKDKAKKAFKPKRFGRTLVIVFTFIIILTAIVASFYSTKPSTKPVSSPVPQTIAKAVSFPVYYPTQDKLPKDLDLDETSFQVPQKDTVVYTINAGKNKKILVSNQLKPSEDEITRFYSSYIPLRTNINTPLGRAQIGAYSNAGKLQNIVSLPVTNMNTWLIITAPSHITEESLKKLLNSLVF